eukprot:1507302-Prorocentrum_lima.AAC.1
MDKLDNNLRRQTKELRCMRRHILKVSLTNRGQAEFLNHHHHHSMLRLFIKRVVDCLRLHHHP